MQFTGTNLLLIETALIDALDNIHNEIATCPDVFEFALSLEHLDRVEILYKRLLSRVQKAIAKQEKAAELEKSAR